MAWARDPLGPGGVLVRAHDGAVEDQVLEVRVVRQGREDAVPHALGGPAAEPPEGAVPAAEGLRQVAPGRAGAHDPQHPLDEHAVVVAGRAGRLRPPQDEARYPHPPRVVQQQTVDRAQDDPPKSSLKSRQPTEGNPKSPHGPRARRAEARGGAPLLRPATPAADGWPGPWRRRARPGWPARSGSRWQGDGCFAATREVWQAHLVARHTSWSAYLWTRPPRRPHSARCCGPASPPRGRAASSGEHSCRASRASGRRSDVLTNYARRLRFIGLLTTAPTAYSEPTRAQDQGTQPARRPERRSGGAEQARRRAGRPGWGAWGRPAGGGAAALEHPGSGPPGSPARTRTAALASNSSGPTRRTPRTTQADPTTNADDEESPRVLSRRAAAAGASSAAVLRCFSSTMFTLLPHASRRSVEGGPRRELGPRRAHQAAGARLQLGGDLRLHRRRPRRRGGGLLRPRDPRQPPEAVILGAFLWIGASVVLHLAARRVLGWLKQ